MRRPFLLLLVALLATAGACGGDDGGAEPTPGAEGAFGEADDCTELVDEAVRAYRQVLERLGDARRTDTERIDEALIAFGDGPDLAVRYDGLGCGADFATAVCEATDRLEAGGPAGRDVLQTLTAGCRAA